MQPATPAISPFAARRRVLAPSLAPLAAVWALAPLGWGQEAYRLPPDDVVAIVDADPAPSLAFSPDGAWALVVERDAMPSIEDVSRRMLRLAGTRIDPAANARYSTSFDRSLAVRDLAGTVELQVPLPDGARLASTTWSHDSEHFAFVVVTDAGSELWCATATQPREPKRVSSALDTILLSPQWTPDGASLLIAEVPSERGDEPEPPRAPRGPNTQSTSGSTSPLRTYQDLLANPHDEALFAHYATTQLVIVSADGASRRELGEPDLYAGADQSYDGERLLVTRLRRPFSYLMPWSSFPQTVEVWGVADGSVTTIAEIPMEEDVPIGGVRTGPRSFRWRPGTEGDAQELVWVEALDGGDPNREAAQRDRWMTLAAPFDGEARELIRVEHRAFGLTFLASPAFVITGEYDRDRRWTRDLLHDLAHPDKAPRVLEDRSIRDRYGDPGNLVMHALADGRYAPMQRGSVVFRTGSGASPEGLLPFLDRQDLMTLETKRLWRCAPGAYESVVKVLLDDVSFITRHETPASPPNYRAHTFHGIQHDVLQLTDYPDPTPQIRGIKKELVKYERADGVPLSATLYLPADYEEGTRLPLFVWAYPIEFNDASTAGQIGSSPWTFTRITGPSHLALVTQGYAVMDAATMPVIGDAETMNDTFIEQIVAAAQAAIDEAVERGVADRDRCAVGGHSYGAFMTANLLAHSDLFMAGIARSGAYNRSLTPFGFQSERRTFWESPETYFAVSPFMHADEISGALLLIHGEIDNNSGTFPIQSQRMFQAIKGHGGTARLVMLPNESHGYRARESVLHVLAEMVDWLDVHVKGEPGPETGLAEEGE